MLQWKAMEWEIQPQPTARYMTLLPHPCSQFPLSIRLKCCYITVHSLLNSFDLLSQGNKFHISLSGKRPTKQISRNYSHRPFKITAVPAFTIFWTVRSSKNTPVSSNMLYQREPHLYWYFPRSGNSWREVTEILLHLYSDTYISFPKSN